MTEPPTTKTQMMSFSKTLHETAALLEEHFLELLFAVALPLIVFFTFFWAVMGMVIVEINATTSYQELLNVFNLENSTIVFAGLAFLLIAFVNILGFVAAPLVAVQHKTITVRKIFPTAMKYFWPAVLMVVMMSIIYFLVIVVSFMFVTVLLTIIAMVNLDAVATAQILLSNTIPTISILLTTLLFTFAPYILVDKNQGAWQAVSTSIELVRKHFWSLLLRIGIMVIVLSVVVFILQFIPVIGSPLAAILGAIILTAYNYILYREISQS